MPVASSSSPQAKIRCECGQHWKACGPHDFWFYFILSQEMPEHMQRRCTALRVTSSCGSHDCFSGCETWCREAWEAQNGLAMGRTGSPRALPAPTAVACVGAQIPSEPTIFQQLECDSDIQGNTHYLHMHRIMRDVINCGLKDPAQIPLAHRPEKGTSIRLTFIIVTWVCAGRLRLGP
jgi:hypothetical protein